MITISKKYLIGLIILFFVLIGVCLLIGFLTKEEDIQRWMLFGTFFFGFVSLTVSIVAMIVSARTYIKAEKDEQRRIARDVDVFMTSFDEQLDLIPLCMVSELYNKNHKYVRDIYNQFNRLNVESKKLLLCKLNIDNELYTDNGWLEKSINIIKDAIQKYELGRDILADNSVFYKNVLKYGSCSYSFEEEFKHIFPDFSPLRKYGFNGGKAEVQNISFFDYTKQYMIWFINRDPRIINYDTKPIDYYLQIVGFDMCDEERKSFIILNIVDTIAELLIDKAKHEGTIKSMPTLTMNNIETLEDRFLMSLHCLLELSKIEKL